jgi:hypothetical protein
MTIEQTVEIPADRRIFLTVPSYIPEGKATITFSVSPADSTPQKVRSWRSYRGIFKDPNDTVADFLERMRADRELEEEIDKRLQSSDTAK